MEKIRFRTHIIRTATSATSPVVLSDEAPARGAGASDSLLRQLKILVRPQQRRGHLFVGNAVLQGILEGHEPGRVGLAVQEAVIEFLDLILV